MIFSCYTTALIKAKEDKANEPPPTPPAPTILNKALYGKYTVDDNCASVQGDCKETKWSFNNKRYSIVCPNEGKKRAAIAFDS